MINKLISKSQVRLLEFEGNPSQDYKDGYCRAIHDVLDLEPIPTLGADEYEKFKADYEARLKADMVAMLDEIQLLAEENIENFYEKDEDDLLQLAQHNAFADCFEQYNDLIQQKINKLKENK